MRETHRPGTDLYKPGEIWDTCDRCDFDYYRSQMVIEADTGLQVCKSCVDPVDRESLIRNRRTIPNGD